MKKIIINDDYDTSTRTLELITTRIKIKNKTFKYLNLNKNTHSLVNRASLPPFHVVSIDQLLDVFTVMADALLSQMIEETFFHLRRYSKLSTSLFTSPEAQVIRFFSTSFFPTPLTITSKFETRRGACGGML